MCVYGAKSCYYHNKITVKAATSLAHNSSTETIDVSKLTQTTSELFRYIDIADAGGRLFCLDRRVSVDCWLKIVTIANDLQSSNVLLMATSNGVVLKTIRNINPGEPLLMWFAENVLAMLNMPYLTSLNVRDGCYKCHVCDLPFDHPNPLKVHLALQCDRFDNSFLWTQLVREFTTNFFQVPLPFSFKLSRLSPNSSNSNAIKKRNSLEDQYSESVYGMNSPNSSGLSASSVGSDIEKSPTSLTSLALLHPISANFLDQDFQIPKKEQAPRYSAFKPYSSNCRLFLPDSNKSSIVACHDQPSSSPSAIIARPDPHAAHMETFFSNLGKSAEGHRCFYCGKLYSRKYGLKIHLRTHTGYKPLKCRVCQRPFGDPSNLNKHIRLHADGELHCK